MLYITNRLWFSPRYHHNKILPKDLQQNSRLMNEQSKVILECAGITLTMGGVFLKM